MSEENKDIGSNSTFWAALVTVSSAMGIFGVFIGYNQSLLLVLLLINFVFIVFVVVCKKWKSKNKHLNNIYTSLPKSSLNISYGLGSLIFIGLTYQIIFAQESKPPEKIIKQLRLRNDTLYDITEKKLDSIYSNFLFPAFKMSSTSVSSVLVSDCDQLERMATIPGMTISPPIAYNDYQKAKVDCKILQYASTLNHESGCPNPVSVISETKKIPAAILKRYISDYDKSTERMIVENKSIYDVLSLKGEVKPPNGTISFDIDDYFYELIPMFSGKSSENLPCETVILVHYGSIGGTLENYDVIRLSLGKGMYKCLDL